MVRMKLFMVNQKVFDLVSYDEYLKSDTTPRGKERYKQKLALREKEFTPVEEFIANVGFENIRKIAVASCGDSILSYTIFYEDNLPTRG